MNFLYVCSVFDKVRNRSIFVTMHETTEDAEREFTRFLSAPQLSAIKNDLVLYLVGTFDPVKLDLIGEDACVLKEGVNVVIEG